MKRLVASLALALLGLALAGTSALANNGKGGGNPGNSGQNATPTAAVPSSHGNAAKPAHPAHPSHPAHPTHPTHPAAPATAHHTSAPTHVHVSHPVPTQHTAPVQHEATTAQASHTSSDNGAGHDKVTLCHATGSAKNPYVKITISRRALSAHSRHQDGRDIVPAPEGGCPGSATSTSSSAMTPASTSGSNGPTTPATSSQTTAAAAPGATAGSTAPSTSGTPKAAGVLGAHKTVSSHGHGLLGALGRSISKGTLPFTGLPLWPVLLAALALLATGYVVRRTASDRR